MIATLLPNNKRMKRLIKDHGEEWDVIVIKPMPCFEGQMGVQIVTKDGEKISNIPINDVSIT